MSEQPKNGPAGYVDKIAELLEGRESRPTWDEYFMSIALLMASRSPCERLHVGCVIVSGGDRKNRLIAAGYNGYLPGSPHISRVRDDHEQGTVHAEQNAVADAARRGVSIEGAAVYISHYPCLNCAKILAAAGVRTVKYHYDYNNDGLVREILSESGIPVSQF